MDWSNPTETSNSRKGKQSTRKTTTTSNTQAQDSIEKSEDTTKSDHHIHLPHFPHPHIPHIPLPHLHHHNEEPPRTPAAPNPTKPPSAHANFLLDPSRSKTSSSTASTTMKRPGGALRRQTSVKTRYMTMLLDLDTIPRLHNILASFFTWILLAGYIVFPGTFTSIQDSSTNPLIANNTTAEKVLKHVKNAPLLWIAGFCCGIGVCGMAWLWWRWRNNFVWLINRIFLPGTLNSLAGLISTIVNVYSQQNRTWSISARVTAIVSGISMIVLAILFALYNFWVLRRVKRRHGKEMRLAEMEGNEDEGIMEKMQRKVMEPALEPGSVV